MLRHFYTNASKRLFLHCYAECYNISTPTAMTPTTLLHGGLRHCCAACYESATLKTMIHHYAVCLATSTSNIATLATLNPTIQIDEKIISN